MHEKWGWVLIAVEQLQCVGNPEANVRIPAIVLEATVRKWSMQVNHVRRRPGPVGPQSHYRPRPNQIEGDVLYAPAAKEPLGADCRDPKLGKGSADVASEGVLTDHGKQPKCKAKATRLTKTRCVLRAALPGEPSGAFA